MAVIVRVYRCVAPRTEPREGAAVTEVIHDAAVWVHDYTRTAQAISPSQARSQPSDDGGSFSSYFRAFSKLENWSSPWLSIGKTIDFYRASAFSRAILI